MDWPYKSLPKTNWWREAVSAVDLEDLFPFSAPSKILNKSTLIASAGSCFAQHVSNALSANGFSYLITEKAPSTFPEELARQYSYGIFTARYGNIYTPLQLRQLVQRATHSFSPVDQFWENSEGRWFDLLRPRITPNGFASLQELNADLDAHLERVRQMFERSQVFVFTLGLTEAWRSIADGTVYPTCPGCNSAGEYDPDKYYFQNFNYNETLDDLTTAIKLITERNPEIKFILSVSPVPLVATMANRHVLESTVYSKSVLRAAVEAARENSKNIYYFPSYEIFTYAGNTSDFFESDQRSVSKLGVSCAMRCFFEQFADFEETDCVGRTGATERGNDSLQPGSEKLVCDEEEFYRSLAANSEDG